LYLHPFCRFPPLREGNRVARLLGSPLRARGTLRRRASIALGFVNFDHAIGIMFL
jgi:hypothetical protein